MNTIMSLFRKFLGIRKSPGITNFKKISDRVYLTSNGIVDFDAPAKLTEEQKWSNLQLEMEQRRADREFERNEEIAKLNGTINMIPRRTVIGIKYVE